MIATGGCAAAQSGDAADHGSGEEDLQAAQPEHQAAHGLQPLEGQFQADQEQQEDDAEFGDPGDVLASTTVNQYRAGTRSMNEPSPSGRGSRPRRDSRGPG